MVTGWSPKPAWPRFDSSRPCSSGYCSQKWNLDNRIGVNSRGVIPPYSIAPLHPWTPGIWRTQVAVTHPPSGCAGSTPAPRTIRVHDVARPYPPIHGNRGAAVYNRKYYERGGAALIRKHNAAAKRRNRELVMAFMESTPCVDCGRRYPHYVMDFDHVRGTKAGDISTMAGKPVGEASLRAEIGKCELVCANCHRGRTWKRIHAGVA